MEDERAAHKATKEMYDAQLESSRSACEAANKQRMSAQNEAAARVAEVENLRTRLMQMGPSANSQVLFDVARAKKVSWDYLLPSDCSRYLLRAHVL